MAVVIDKKEDHYTIVVNRIPTIDIYMIGESENVYVTFIDSKLKIKADSEKLVTILFTKLLDMLKYDPEFPLLKVLSAYYKIVLENPPLKTNDEDMLGYADFGQFHLEFSSQSYNVSARSQIARAFRLTVLSLGNADKLIHQFSLRINEVSADELPTGLLVTVDGNQFLIPKSSYGVLSPIVELVKEFTSNLNKTIKVG